MKKPHRLGVSGRWWGRGTGILTSFRGWAGVAVATEVGSVFQHPSPKRPILCYGDGYLVGVPSYSTLAGREKSNFGSTSNRLIRK